MRAVLQRVLKAEVRVEGKVVGSIGPGVVTLLGVAAADSPSTAEKMISKIIRLRVFADEEGKMNLSLLDVRGGHLIVSQFTLYGDLTKGNRPSFIDAAPSEQARAIYEHALAFSSAQGVLTSSGVFQANMQVELVNDGPATFLLEVDEA